MDKDKVDFIGNPLLVGAQNARSLTPNAVGANFEILKTAKGMCMGGDHLVIGTIDTIIGADVHEQVDIPLPTYAEKETEVIMAQWINPKTMEFKGTLNKEDASRVWFCLDKDGQHSELTNHALTEIVDCGDDAYHIMINAGELATSNNRHIAGVRDIISHHIAGSITPQEETSEQATPPIEPRPAGMNAVKRHIPTEQIKKPDTKHCKVTGGFIDPDTFTKSIRPNGKSY